MTRVGALRLHVETRHDETLEDTEATQLILETPFDIKADVHDIRVVVVGEDDDDEEEEEDA